MSMIRLSTTSYVVLGLIALRGPSTSYDLKRSLDHSIGFSWPFPHAQLYDEPERLVHEGLLSVDRESEGRRRKTYSITASGRDAFARWLAQPTGERFQIRNVAGIKLLLGELVSSNDLETLAQTQIELHRLRLAELDTLANRFPRRGDLPSRRLPLALSRRIEVAAHDFWLDYLQEASQEAPWRGGSVL